MIRYVSLDLDGTLIKQGFDTIIWDTVIPRLYAKKKNISLEEAEKIVYADYYKALYVEKQPQWTNLDYWCQRLGLPDKEELFKDVQEKDVVLYEDVEESIQALAQEYKLIIITSGDHEFNTFKLKRIRHYFTKVFSSQDFNQPFKNKKTYEGVLQELGIPATALVHAGDDYHRDYLIPRSIGINAYHLARGKAFVKGEHTIHSLRELKERIKELD